MTERDPADVLAETLGAAGYAVTVERFAARPSPEPWLASYAGLSAAAALLVYPLPLVTVLVGIVAVVLHARESDGRPLLRRFARDGVNVVARAPAAASAGAVVVAGLVPPHRRLNEATARTLGLCLQVLMTAVPAGGAAAWLAEAETELPAAVATGGAVAAVALVGLVLFLYRPPGGEPPEANPALDVLVEIAPLVRGERVWLVAAGSGSDAVAALGDAHPDEVAGAAWINLEAAPAGDVVAVSEEGTWRERRSDRWLMGAAEEAGAEVRPHRVATRATALLARRRRALTLLVPPGRAGARIAAAVVRGGRG
jgi:hypothetical protein